MYSFARMAITKHHRLEDLTEISFLTVLEAKHSGSRYWQVSESSEASLFSFEKRAFLPSCCVLIWASLVAWVFLVSPWLSKFPLLLRTTLISDKGPTLTASFDHLFKDLISKYSYILRLSLSSLFSQSNHAGAENWRMFSEILTKRPGFQLQQFRREINWKWQSLTISWILCGVTLSLFKYSRKEVAHLQGWHNDPGSFSHINSSAQAFQGGPGDSLQST